MLRSIHAIRSRRFAFVFICQAGEWEIKALLLAATLRRWLRCRYELIAAIPSPAALWGTPHSATLDQLRRWGIRTLAITNPIDGKFSHANKIECLAVPSHAEKIVFLDSDMLCLRQFADEARFAVPINVKPADMQTFSANQSDWERVYRTVDVPRPTWRTTTTFTGESGYPYFNSGFVAINRGVGLAAAWRVCCQKIYADTGISERRLYSDQISLATAIVSLGLTVDCLDERYNYPVHHRPLVTDSLPIFAHYHEPSYIRPEPLLRACIRQIAERYPVLYTIAAPYPEWRELLSERRR